MGILLLGISFVSLILQLHNNYKRTRLLLPWFFGCNRPTTSGQPGWHIHGLWLAATVIPLAVIITAIITINATHDDTKIRSYPILAALLFFCLSFPHAYYFYNPAPGSVRVSQREDVTRRKIRAIWGP
jgi:hypothetical protein